MSHPEFERLLQDYLDGDLDETGRIAFCKEVETNPSAAQAFDEAIGLETLLSAAHANASLEQRIAVGVRGELGRPKILHPIWFGTRLAAAALLCLGLTWWVVHLRSSAISRYQLLSGEVMVSGNTVTTLRNGETFTIGQLKPAVIQLSDGSTIEFGPGSVAEVRGAVHGMRQVIVMSAGLGRFQVKKAGGQFRVETPLGQVTVLGTEFSVALRPVNEFEATFNQEPEIMKTKAVLALAVAVTFGQVQVDIGGKTYTLSAGQTVYAKEGEKKPVRELKGELTKVEGKTLTITQKKDSGDQDTTVALNDQTKVLIETGETEPIQGRESKTRKKTIDGKVEDLKVGQRVNVLVSEGVATRVLVPKLEEKRSKEGERRESGPPAKKENKEGKDKKRKE